MTLFEIVMKLIGPVEPVGESHTDAERFDNLMTLLELMEELHTNVDRIAYENKDRAEYSMNRAGKLCAKYIDDLGIPD